MNVAATTLLAAVLPLTACSGPDAAEAARAAQIALDRGEPARALALTEDALPAAREAADRGLVWRLEALGLLALSEQGQGPDAIATLERLSGVFPKAVDAALYARLARRASTAGQLDAALDLALAGGVRFPDRQVDFDQIKEDVSRKAEAGGDDPILDRLNQRGYLGGGG